MKNFFCIIICLFAASASAQVEHVDIPVEEKTKTDLKYDSLILKPDGRITLSVNNVDISLLKRYVGQEFVLLPKSKKRKDKYPGYDALTTSIRHDARDRKTNVYHPEKGEYHSGWGTYDYYSDSLLAGERFKVVDVISAGNPYYKLYNQTYNDTAYYCVYPNGDINKLYNVQPPLFPVGYYEKLKTLFVNKEYVRSRSGYEKMVDLNTGYDTQIPLNGTAWVCSKIATMDVGNGKYEEMAIVLDDGSGGKVALTTDCFISCFTERKRYEDSMRKVEETERQQRIAREQENAAAKEREALEEAREKKEYNSRIAAAEKAKAERKKHLIQKYGMEKGTEIAAGHVKIGMTREMCTDAWGKPVRIHTTEAKGYKQEQWVYGLSKYLYFDKKGLLTVIQDVK